MMSNFFSRTTSYAGIAGSVLYGGAIDDYNLAGMYPYSSGTMFNMLKTTPPIQAFLLFHFPYTHVQATFLTTEVTFVKIIHAQCTVYPGEMFQVSVIAVGQRDGTVPSSHKNYRKY